MRLIDADELKKELYPQWLMDILLTQRYSEDILYALAQKIDEQPTAYDVDKRDNAWHNLKDQKPEDGQEVLTWDGLGVHEDRWSDDADYFESTDAKEIWWKDMPEPPEV